MAIHIGCGSWADPEYVGLLFPKSLPSKARLSGYAKWFDRVELNASYHHLPTPETMRGWSAQTPAGFIFDVKLPQDFSRSPATAAKKELGKRVMAAVEPLIEAKKFGSFLLTLAPSFTPTSHQLDELDGVAEALGPCLVAVELRNRGWVERDSFSMTLDYFRSRGFVWVALDLPSIDSPKLLPAIDEVTNSRLGYMRLHGRNPRYLEAESAEEKHRYQYSGHELEEVVERIRTLAAKATDVHVSVNNHAKDFAPKAAIALRRLLGQRVPES